MTRFRIRLFGRLNLQQEDGTSYEIESHKATELFCYLLIHRNRPHSREALAEIIWGESSTARSKKYLRQALWQIQSALTNTQHETLQPLILTDGEWIQINPQTECWLDVAEFEDTYTCVRDHHGGDLDEAGYRKLKQALNLYQGDLLEGWYEDWCLFERERLQNIYLSILDKLMMYCETHQSYEEALEFGENILRYDVARERTHRRMVRIYYKAGERTSALRQYERCVTSLQDELGVKPAKKTVELYELICQDNAYPVEQTPLFLVPPDTTPDILHRLRQLEKMVGDFHVKVTEEIRSLEQSLKQ